MAGSQLIGLLRRLSASLPTSEERVIGLHGRQLAYRLRRSARRTLALQLDTAGVRVSVPQHASVADVERFIEQHAGWLQSRLIERERDQAAATFVAADGVYFPLFGRDCRLAVEADRRRAVWSHDAHGEVLLVSAADVPAALVRALRHRALPDFTERVRLHCERLGLALPAVRLTSARTRWGSCSARSGIRLHWRLVHMAPELIDYVVAHEVAHLIEMNHSPRFWTIVVKLHPDWRASRQRLRAVARTLPVIQPGCGPGPRNED